MLYLRGPISAILTSSSLTRKGRTQSFRSISDDFFRVFQMKKFSMHALDSDRSVCMAVICYRSDISGSEKWPAPWGEKKLNNPVQGIKILRSVYLDKFEGSNERFYINSCLTFERYELLLAATKLLQIK